MAPRSLKRFGPSSWSGRSILRLRHRKAGSQGALMRVFLHASIAGLCAEGSVRGGWFGLRGIVFIWGRRAMRWRQACQRGGSGNAVNRTSCSGTASHERPSGEGARKRLSDGTWQGADSHSLDTRNERNWKEHTSSVIHLTSAGEY